MSTSGDVPVFFRLALDVSDLAAATKFYAELLGSAGRSIRGGRHYFDCGAVILALVDHSADEHKPRPMGGHIYFSVNKLEEIHERARGLGCLSEGNVHEEAGGEIVTRPWGERSFYVVDPFKNRICFVDAKTLFTGR